MRVPWRLVAFGVMPGLLCLGAHSARSQTVTSLRPNGPDSLLPNAPFTIARVTRTETRLQNGTALQHEARETLTRDAQGRLLDRISIVPPDPLAQPAVFLMLADPLAGTVTQWRLGQSEATSQAIQPHTRFEVQALGGDLAQDHRVVKTAADTTTEDLGKQEIAGLSTTGSRTTTTLAAGVIGNTEPLRIVHEVWIADSPEATSRSERPGRWKNSADPLRGWWAVCRRASC